MNSILHFHAKMRPKTDFSFTLSEWRNPDYVSHGHKALILLLRSAPCSMHSEGAGDTGEVKYPPAFGQPACRSKDPTSLCLRCPGCCSCCGSLPVPPPPPSPPCFLSLLIRFLKGLHSHFVCPLWGKGFAFALFHCCKINQNVCEI